jgi:hypothetical protein
MFWVLYQKGSFRLKEKFIYHHAAVTRACCIRQSAVSVLITDTENSSAERLGLLAGAFEFDSTAGKLVLRGKHDPIDKFGESYDVLGFMAKAGYLYRAETRLPTNAANCSASCRKLTNDKL